MMEKDWMFVMANFILKRMWTEIIKQHRVKVVFEPFELRDLKEMKAGLFFDNNLVGHTVYLKLRDGFTPVKVLEYREGKGALAGVHRVSDLGWCNLNKYFTSGKLLCEDKLKRTFTHLHPDYCKVVAEADAKRQGR